jgi:hypothetical protein
MSLGGQRTVGLGVAEGLGADEAERLRAGQLGRGRDADHGHPPAVADYFGGDRVAALAVDQGGLVRLDPGGPFSAAQNGGSISPNGEPTGSPGRQEIDRWVGSGALLASSLHSGARGRVPGFRSQNRGTLPRALTRNSTGRSDLDRGRQPLPFDRRLLDRPDHLGAPGNLTDRREALAVGVAPATKIQLGLVADAQ